MKYIPAGICLLFLLPVWVQLQAQDRCGTDQYHKHHSHETTRQFEEWLNKVQPQAGQRVDIGGRSQAVYTIPVVVHIIHNGESDVTNISDAQVLSQLRVLNADYNRTNTDASNTPAEWAGVVGSLAIEFRLARRDPEGRATTGIVRVQGPKNSWTIADNYQLKSLSYWPAEDYLNIWVCNLTDYLGYAQFPESTLGGLESSSPNRLTDGVVVAYDAFGSSDDGNFVLQTRFNKGRTATHEIGHFFGLRHIWGDDQSGCGGNGDYVADTPDQAGQTTGCPSHPRASCDNTSMFQNYLDYTNDRCMNLFTQGQVERMTVVLENSPRRNSLLQSAALNDPDPVINDLGIRAVLTPASGTCPGEVSPSLEVRNYGTNDISNTQVEFYRDGVLVETRAFDLTLAPDALAAITFAPTAVASATAEFEFRIISTNNLTDGFAANNTRVVTVEVPDFGTIPVNEGFDNVPASWAIRNPDNLFTWEQVTAPASSPSNKALKMNFYDYEDAEGEIDVLLSPAFDLSAADAALLLFDVAYAPYQGNNDRLRVLLLTDCGTDVADGIVLYEKSAQGLGTTAQTTASFTPSSAADWRTEAINLVSFAGQRGVRLAFVGVNGYGNNLYLDNIRLLTADFFNLTLKKIVSPAPAECSGSITPQIIVGNSGSAVSSFAVEITVAGVTTRQSINGVNLAPGTEQTVSLAPVTLPEGESAITITVLNATGQPDEDPADNSLTAPVLARTAGITVPFRESFEGNFTSRWSAATASGNPGWESSGSGTAAYRAFSNAGENDQAWLVSPAFDLSGQTEASISFDVSYAQRNTSAVETLDVLVARGCDAPFETVDSYPGTSLAVTTSATEWTPQADDDWRRNVGVDLSDYAGEPSVRLAFRVTNRNGNNLYLDNVQLFLTSEPSPATFEGPFYIHPNPDVRGTASQITFNLPETQDVLVEVIDNTGRIITTRALTSVLNQSIPVFTTDARPGVYLVRITTPTGRYASRVVSTQ